MDDALEDRIRESFEAYPDMMGGLMAVYRLGEYAGATAAMHSLMSAPVIGHPRPETDVSGGDHD